MTLSPSNAGSALANTLLSSFDPAQTQRPGSGSGAHTPIFANRSRGTVAPVFTAQGPDSQKLENTQSAINELEQIPDQLKAQAHDWAQQQLSHLLKVLDVTLLNNPSESSLKDLAKGISSAAKDIAASDNQSAKNPGTGGTEIDISISETESDQKLSLVSSDGKNTTAFSAESKTDTLSVKIEITQNGGGDGLSTLAGYAKDASLLAEASAALGQIKTALEQQGGHKGLRQAIDGTNNDVLKSLHQVVNDAVTALTGSPDASLTSGAAFNLST